MSDPRTRQFVTLLARHEARLHGYILTLLPHWADAEEVLQEVNLIMWEKFDQYEPGTNFFAWGCQIARYEVMRARRRRDRDHVRFSDATLDTLADETESMQDELVDRSQALLECMTKLPDRDRNLIELRYAEGATTLSVAEATGRSTDAVYKALARIRRTLHDCIQRALGIGGDA